MARASFTLPSRRYYRRLAVATLSLLLCGPNAGAQTDGANVRGRVADAAGSPLVDFPVLVIDSGGRAVPLRTGGGGRFQTIGLAAGPVTIALDARGFAQTAVRCRVPSGQTAFVELFVAATRTTQLPPARCRIEPPTSDVYIIE